ncbi:hypothetical protein BDK51DRAFT_27801, partial [Blyttiomyces helicus]
LRELYLLDAALDDVFVFLGGGGGGSGGGAAGGNGSAASNGGGGGGGGGGGDDRPVSNEPSWKLRIVSTDTASLSVARDTEKEDRYRAIKDSWEAAQPGRAARGREARDGYLKLVESGAGRSAPASAVAGTSSSSSSGPKPMTAGAPTARSSVFSPDSARPSVSRGVFTPAAATDENVGRTTSRASTVQLSTPGAAGARGLLHTAPAVGVPRVLTAEEIEARALERERRMAEHERVHDSVRRARAEDRERRFAIKQHQADRVEEKNREVDGWKEVDTGRRDLYRMRVMREIEEAQARALRAAMEAAARAAETAAELGAAEEAAAAAAVADRMKKKVGKVR